MFLFSFFQFCDIENLKFFSKALATLVEFTLKMENPEIFQFFCQEDDKIVKKQNAVLKAIFIVAEWLEKKLVSKKALLAHNINCCQLQSFQREEGLCDNQALEI